MFENKSSFLNFLDCRLIAFGRSINQDVAIYDRLYFFFRVNYFLDLSIRELENTPTLYV